MRYVYPATVEQDEDGQFIVNFRDVPEALTSGETLEEALAEAVDCLVVALDGYVDERGPRPLPRPSRSHPGEHPVSVPPLIAAKLALHDAMRDAGLTPAALAERLGLSEAAARRLARSWPPLPDRGAQAALTILAGECRAGTRSPGRSGAGAASARSRPGAGRHPCRQCWGAEGRSTSAAVRAAVARQPR